MSIVTEMCGAGFFYLECYFLNRVTCYTCIESKGFLTVMTGAARFTLFHIFHGETLIMAGGKKRRVTYAAIS